MLQFYSKPMLLDRSGHHDVRLGPQKSFKFASNTNCVMLVGEEFQAVSRHYPIGFLQVSSLEYFPVAMVGLRSAENLFIDANNCWFENAYIPAFVRRHPFVLTDRGDVCIDGAADNLGGDGDRLFEADGAVAPILRYTLSFLSAFQRAVQATRAFAAHLVQLELLVDWPAQVVASTGAAYQIDGLKVVDRARLAEVPACLAAGAWQTDAHDWIAAHHASLDCLSDLAARLDGRRTGRWAQTASVQDAPP